VGLTVAVTGPTGDIGKSVVRALEAEDEVERIIGMARRPFDPAEHGWTRAEYRQGDILDRASLDELFAGVDVAVHLAFVIFGSHAETRQVNLEGTRNVFGAAVAAGARRLVYTSSVAAYGFPDVDGRITEDVEPRGLDRFYYSAQKGELEGVLAEAIDGTEVEAYLLRPCVVAGRDAPTLIEQLTGAFRLGGPLRSIGRMVGSVPGVAPVLPDPGVPFQLVHHDDVAAALVAAVLGRGEPGPYNLAADDELSVRELAAALGWHSVPIPRAGVAAAAEVVARVPKLPAEMAWIEAFRKPVIMDCTRARTKLGWDPKHSSRQTLDETIARGRESGLL
jgi:nucleoside-diphosphate-sugar epimerase